MQFLILQSRNAIYNFLLHVSLDSAFIFSFWMLFRHGPILWMKFSNHSVLLDLESLSFNFWKAVLFCEQYDECLGASQIRPITVLTVVQFLILQSQIQ